MMSRYVRDQAKPGPFLFYCDLLLGLNLEHGIYQITTGFRWCCTNELGCLSLNDSYDPSQRHSFTARG